MANIFCNDEITRINYQISRFAMLLLLGVNTRAAIDTSFPYAVQGVRVE